MPATVAKKPREAGSGLSPERSSPSLDESDLPALIANLRGAARESFVERHPELLAVATVERLCRHSTAALNEELDEAERAAAAAVWLAERLGDEMALALAERALANLLHEKGEYPRAQRHYDRVRQRFRRLGDALQEAITLSSALHNLIHVGAYDRAHRWYEAARRIYEERDDRLRLARLELNYANVLHRQDLWRQAMTRYERALAEFQTSGHSRDAAICLRNMATCHINMMNTRRALDCYLRAKRLIEEHGWTRLAIENEYNIAYLHFHTADYAHALRLYEKSRQQFEEIGDERHRALCDLDQSEIYLELNLVEEAAELAGWAQESFERIGLRYEAARAVTNLGVALSRQGRIFKALETLARARQMFVEEANEFWPAQVDLYQAILLYREGRSFEATSLAASSAARFESIGLLARTAACEMLLARIVLDEGDLEEAERLCQQVARRLEREPSPALEFDALLLHGIVREAAGDRHEARRIYLLAHERAERLRGHLQTDELKIDLFRSKLRVHEAIVSLTLQGSTTPAERREAFTATEKAKARTLADLMAFRAHVLPPKAATRSNLVENIRSLREELNWYYRQIDLRQRTQDGSTLEQLEELRRRSQGKERQLVRTLDELAASDRELSSLQSATVVAIEEIQSALPPATALVEYFFARGAIYAAMLTADGIEMQPLTVVSRVREQHRMLQFQLSRLQLGREFLERHRSAVDSDTEGHLTTLFEELLAPIWPRLLEFEELVIVPHGFLHHLPFQALFDGSRFMIDRFRISYAPSASVAHLCRLKPRRSGRDGLVVGVASGEADEVELEARAVAAALDGARVVLDGSLDGDGLAAAAGSGRLLHLATRALYRRDNPMFSSLDLGRHRLTLFDVYSLQLDVELVGLSGCCAGLDTLIGTEALLGLSRGLLFAGARTVVVDLWKGDAATHRSLLADFYARLGETPPAAALRSAQLALRERHPHPFFWAPYQLIGCGD